MSTQYATWDRALTWLVDKLFAAPLFYISQAVDKAFADFGSDD